VEGGETRFLPSHTTKEQDNLLILLPVKRDKNLQYMDNKLNNDDDNNKRINSVHLLILFTYLFLILHSLSPDSTITYLYIFLSLSYSFLLVAA